MEQVSIDFLIRVLSDIQQGKDAVKTLQQLDKQMEKTDQQTKKTAQVNGDFVGTVKQSSEVLSNLGNTAMKGATQIGESFIVSERGVGTLTKTFIKDKVIWTETFRGMSGQLEKTGEGFYDMGLKAKLSKTMVDDYIMAIKRVAIVVPVWMAARAAISAVSQVIRNGLQIYMDTESQLARAQRVTRGVTGDMEGAMALLSLKAREFTKTHSGMAKDVIEAYYRMSTAGHDFNKSLSASIPIVKLALSTGTDVGKVGESVAGIYNVLGDTIKGTNSEEEKMYKLVSILGRAYTEHQIEIDQVTAAIGTSGAMAKSFGLDLVDLVSVLSIAHDNLIKSSKAGTLFGRSLQDLAKNLPKVEAILGQQFKSNEPIKWFQVFLQLIEKFKRAGATTPEIYQKLSEIFGLVSKREVMILIRQFDKLKATHEDLNKVTEDYINNLSDVEDKILPRQLENLRKNLSYLIADFVTGVIGARDFASGLADINQELSRWSEGAELGGLMIGKFADALGRLGRMLTLLPVTAAVFFDQFKRLAEDAGIKLNPLSVLFLTPDFLKSLDLAKSKNIDPKRYAVEMTTTLQAAAQEYKDILEGTYKGKATEDVFSAHERIRTKYAEQRQKVLDKELAGQNQLNNKNKENNAIIDDNNDGGQEGIGILGDSISKARLYLDYFTDISNTMGVTKRQQLEFNIEMNTTLGLYKDEQEKLKDQLELQQEITKEKEEQNYYSDESLKLIKIAQKYGMETAQNVQKILSGDVPVEGLFGRFQSVEERKTEAAFKELFKSKYEQIQAKQFMTGTGRFDRFRGGTPSDLKLPEDISVKQVMITSQKELNEFKDLVKTIKDSRFSKETAIESDSALVKGETVTVITPSGGTVTISKSKISPDMPEIVDIHPGELMAGQGIINGRKIPKEGEMLDTGWIKNRGDEMQFFDYRKMNKEVLSKPIEIKPPQVIVNVQIGEEAILDKFRKVTTEIFNKGTDLGQKLNKEITNLIENY